MRDAQNPLDIFFILKEKLFVNQERSIAEHHSEKQIRTPCPAALDGSDYEVIIKNKLRISF